jgi:hypothetical protein
LGRSLVVSRHHPEEGRRGVHRLVEVTNLAFQRPVARGGWLGTIKFAMV